MMLLSHRISALLLGACLIALLGILFWHFAQESAPSEVRTLDELEHYLNDLVASGDPPALSIGVVKDGEIVYLRAFGKADGPNRIAATPETLFRWWSLTKILTAVAIFQLSEKGDLELNDKVTDHLPFFEPVFASETDQPLTIGHLLNHSSGIPEAGLKTYSWIHSGKSSPSQTVFAGEVVPKHARLQFEPGTKGIYSNLNYVLLGAVIEAASGIDYRAYVAENILKPLRMSSTVFDLDCRLEPWTAYGSHPVLSFQSILLPALGSFPDGIREIADGQIWLERLQFDATACGSLIGPATDAVRFMQAYLDEGTLEAVRILSRESVMLMTDGLHVSAGRSRASRSYPDMKHGAAWFIIPGRDSEYLQHTGFGPGFAAIMRLYPESDLGIVILSNGAGLDRSRTVDLLARLLGGNG